MGILVVMLLIFVVILAVLLGLSVGVALLIVWLLPSVGLGMALLGQAMLIFGRLMNTLPESPELEGESQPPIVILDREVTLPRRRRKGA
jgi:hypothetical protein